MKKIIIILLAGILVGAGLMGWFVWRGRDHSSPPTGTTAGKVPPGQVKPRVIETTPAIRKILPGYKPSAADNATAGWEPGTSIIHYTPAEGPPIDIAVTPGGEVFAPQGIAANIVVYKKPIPAVRFAPRAFAGGGYGTGGITGAIGADIVEIKRAKIGVAAIVDRHPAEGDQPRSIEIAGGISAGADIISTIGVRGIAAVNPGGEFRAAIVGTIGIP